MIRYWLFSILFGFCLFRLIWFSWFMCIYLFDVWWFLFALWSSILYLLVGYYLCVHLWLGDSVLFLIVWLWLVGELVCCCVCLGWCLLVVYCFCFLGCLFNTFVCCVNAYWFWLLGWFVWFWCSMMLGHLIVLWFSFIEVFSITLSFGLICACRYFCFVIEFCCLWIVWCIWFTFWTCG